MATSYKTPGVYVEEIVKFPPSVAEVETAIPAFVGYTQKARRFLDDDLILFPIRITSLLEYEQYFGQGPSYASLKVQLNSNNVVDEEATAVTNSIYNLYESLRLFYDNGGGPCYICCAGKYADNHNDALRATKITAGLGEIRKFDEPTLLLFPDAVNIKTGAAVDWDKLAAIQQQALMQCGDLGDRFAILDVPDEAAKTVSEEAEAFRSRVGMNSLKYGAAYMPFVKTVYDKAFRLQDLMENLYDSTGTKIEMKSLFGDNDKDAGGKLIKTKLDEFKATYTDVESISAQLSVFSGKAATEPFSAATLDAKFAALKLALANAADDDARKAALKPAFEFISQIFAQLEGLAVTTAADHAAETDTSSTIVGAAGKFIRTKMISNAALKTSVQNLLGGSLKTSLQSLKNLVDEAYVKGGAEISSTAADQPSPLGFDVFTTANWAPAAATDEAFLSPAGTFPEKATAAFAALAKIYASAKAGVTAVLSAAASSVTASEDALVADLPIYRSAVNVLNKKVNTLPPSGAIAGVYATVDRERGVWKAPANVSLNSVSGLSEYIDDAAQESLNIDSTAGKSINALRAFYGKGIMVWGSRTLAGNDNEWRYVPVRRFFSFVEESCKKSTSWAVFEPNDANTWLRIKAQIENFLNNLWRNGALAGAKPEHAYIVSCGLGVTMTAQDILNGYLNVEVAMAAVRPAEFVVLKFSHKLQQS